MRDINLDNKQIHVVHIVENLEIGGMENGVINIVNMIDSQRFKISIGCLSHPGALASRIANNKVSVHSFNWKGGLDLYLFISLYRYFRINVPDIIHTHGWLTLLYGAVAGLMANVPVIINGEHGVFNLDNVRRRIAYKILAKITDKFLAVSESIKYKLISLNIDEDKIEVIPNGVDSKRFSPKNREQINIIRSNIGIPISSFLIGSIGRLEPVKNYEMLLNAFNELEKEFSFIRCIIVGDGSERERLEKIALSIGDKSKVYFLGKTNSPETIYPILDIFVLTSLNEGMSNTILEAMSCGKPIYATKVGGNTELVVDGYNGILVDSNDSVEFAKCIRKIIIDHSLLEYYGNNSRNVVMDKHSMIAMVDKYSKIYTEVLYSKIN